MPPLETQTIAPSSLAAYTRPDLIIPQLRQRDAAGIISELSLLLQRQGGVLDVLPFYHTALNQELLASSALECGIALPHARLSGVRKLQFALGRVAEPVPWGTKCARPVEWIFLLAVPATDAEHYLHLLGSLARLGQDTDRLEQLRSAAGAEEMLAVLERVPIRPGAFSALP